MSEGEKVMQAFRKLNLHLALNMDEKGLDLLNEGLGDWIEFLKKLKTVVNAAKREGRNG